MAATAASGPKRGPERVPSASKKWKTDPNEVHESSFVHDLVSMDEATDELSPTDKWARPLAPLLDTRKQGLAFQQMELDSYIDKPMPGMPGPRNNQVQIMRMYGITMEGHSVLAHVHGFAPYLYCPAPPRFTENHLGEFKTKLDALVRSQSSFAKDFSEVVLAVELVERQSIMGYHSSGVRPFLKVTIIQHRFIGATRRVLESGTLVTSLGCHALDAFESNIELNLRFMIDLEVVGCNWIEMKPGDYFLRSESAKVSTAQYEIDVAFNKFISHPAEDEWDKVAPLRILSFDIECAGRKGIFPEPEKDPVIQIANMVQEQGAKRPFIRNIFTLGTCAAIVGSQVLPYENEKDLLEAWTDFVQRCDPDIITGYNTANFDLPYLYNRAKQLGASKFPYLGRLKGIQSKLSDTKFTSKAFGSREDKALSMDGRIPFDVLQVLQRDQKLRSYTLNSVSAHFLGEQKEDVHHSIITDLQNGNDQTRRRLAVYCMKDAYLPIRLLDKLMCITNYMEMARVTGVPLTYLLTRGQQIKVVSQLLRHAGKHQLVMPVIESQGSQEQYEGATVIDPKKGYYDTPVATLDFSSLYPSIMMAHNLCYTTLIQSKTEEDKLSSEKYIKTPTSNLFVKPEVRKGLLPQILESLLAARKRAKHDLKNETDPFKRGVLNGRQLALKVSANSVYGFTGALVGKLPCLEISASVTAFGRQMIDLTKNTVEERYTRANGYDYDAEVIYGDTDSVMIKFGEPDLAKTMKLAEQAAEYVTKKFERPIKLEFEKVYFPYLLINKKRYAGLYWTNPHKWDKMDAKGIVTVRRDNCPLVVSLINTCLHKLLIERDVEGAVEFAKKTISDLLCNHIDISQLVITKALAKSREEYDGKQAHAELAERMRQRDAGSAPTLGDRVAYVIIQGRKGAPAFEKSEDPIYVLEHNIPLDTKYYLHNQLEKPLLSIFEPIMGERARAQLLAGEHTLVVVQTNVKSIKGGLARFTTKTEKCIGCRALLEKGDTALCKRCKADEPTHYQREVEKLTALEHKFGRLWSQCQRCQGSLHQDVLCTSKDCPIFYMRKKVQKDLKTQDSILSRFSTAW